MINRYFHYKADKAYRVFSYVIFQTEEHKNIQYTDSSYDYTLTESVLLFLCLRTLHSPSKSLDKANVMSFLIILVPSLDLLSILLKTDSNKIVFFAATFVRYEKIHTGYIYSDTDSCKCFSTRTVPYGYQRHYFRTEQKGTAQTKGGSQKFPL